MPADESRVRWIVKVILMHLAEYRKLVSNVHARIQLLTYIKFGKKARLNGLLTKNQAYGRWFTYSMIALIITTIGGTILKSKLTM